MFFLFVVVGMVGDVVVVVMGIVLVVGVDVGWGVVDVVGVVLVVVGVVIEVGVVLVGGYGFLFGICGRLWWRWVVGVFFCFV